ncbi:MAG: hypothetical protein ACKV19_02490 [Verrucomicrobiales bacterium]
MPSAETAPPSRSLLHRPGCWITFLTVIPLLIGGAYVAHNWSGARQLARARSAIAAAGIEWDLRQIPVAPKSADSAGDDNFCAAPMVRSIIDGTAAGPDYEALQRVAEWHQCVTKAGVRLQSARHPAPTDWTAVRDEVVAGDPKAQIDPSADPVVALTASLERDLAPVLSELVAALPRNSSVIGPRFVESLRRGKVFDSHTPWMDDMRKLSMALYLRGRLHLERGNLEPVLSSARVLLRLADGAERHGSAVGGLIGLSLRSLVHNIIWVAATHRSLPPEAWRELATLMRDQQPLERLPQTIQGEVVFVHQALALLRDNPSELSALSSDPQWGSWQLFRTFLPRGWFDASEAIILGSYANIARAIQNPSLPNRFTVATFPSEEIKNQLLPDHRFLASILMDPPANWVRHFASSHAISQLAEVACQLEIFWHQRQAYPESLDALVPDYLPAIPIDFDGRPIRYAAAPATGRYRLWSVGSDGQDDGGVEKAAEAGAPKPWNEPIGDWLWQYPKASTPTR